MNIFQDLKNKLEKGFEQAGNKSQRVFEMSRLSLKMKNKREELEELQQRLGDLIYKQWLQTQTLTETDEITAALKAVQQLDQEIAGQEGELTRLKSSNITTRTSAETVKIPITTGEEEVAPVATNTVPPVSTVPPTNTVPEAIYLCPFCAQQVEKQISRCPHCEQGFY
jgi:hypothetical protein